MEKRTEVLLGSSAAIVELLRIIAKVAPTRATVLIEGESGTGKELVARTIHRKSTRASGPFIALNCAALPENLMESELFGHERGAFTGADTTQKGEFELASGGTLFLDEIGELPSAMQAKLLRALQEREIRRIGGHSVIPVDVRFIAATSRNLQTCGFRPELYYRLNIVSVRTPPLRDRKEDIAVLARHFLEKFGTEIERPVADISATAEEALMHYDWPGNVRQLEGAIQQAMVLGSSAMIEVDDLPRFVFSAFQEPQTYKEALKACRRGIIERALAQAGGDYKRAAAILELYPTSLYKFMRNLGMKS